MEKPGGGGIHLSSQLLGSINRRIGVHAIIDEKQHFISKITRAKRAGGMAQEVECLPEFRLQYKHTKRL
jgi:hypothetical protein